MYKILKDLIFVYFYARLIEMVRILVKSFYCEEVAQDFLNDFILENDILEMKVISFNESLTYTIEYMEH